MKNFNILLVIVVVFVARSAAASTLGDCFWGGSNEETSYTRSFVPGMGGVTLAQVAPPPMNLGAPPAGIPVQATPNTQSMTVPQTNIPTITVPTGPIGTVGQPATHPGAAGAVTHPQMPPGTEIVYVVPVTPQDGERCLDGTKGIPAKATKIVPAGTPGAIPVAVRTMTVIKPKVTHEWSYSRIRTRTETLVKVVDPRTGQVVRTYCKNDEEKSGLAWPHRKEVVKYERVNVKVATPVSINPAAAGTAATNVYSTGQRPDTTPATSWNAQYPLWTPSAETPIESSTQTLIIP